jgi:predicted metal-dependent phosphoesterase TrpH
LIRVETHSHSTASDGALTPLDLVRLAAKRGCGAIAVTDHDTIEGGLSAFKAAKRLGLPITVIPGVEVRTTWGDVLALCREPPGTEPPKDPFALRDWADGESCILVPAHPYHPARSSLGGRNLLRGAAEGLWDAIEAWNSRGLPLFNIPALRVASKLGLPMTSGSDAHAPREVCTSPVILEEGGDASSIVDAIAKGRARITPGVPSPLAYAEALALALSRRLGLTPWSPSGI